MLRGTKIGAMRAQARNLRRHFHRFKLETQTILLLGKGQQLGATRHTNEVQYVVYISGAPDFDHFAQNSSQEFYPTLRETMPLRRA